MSRSRTRRARGAHRRQSRHHKLSAIIPRTIRHSSFTREIARGYSLLPAWSLTWVRRRVGRPQTSKQRRARLLSARDVDQSRCRPSTASDHCTPRRTSGCFRWRRCVNRTRRACGLVVTRPGAPPFNRVCDERRRFRKWRRGACSQRIGRNAEALSRTQSANVRAGLPVTSCTVDVTNAGCPLAAAHASRSMLATGAGIVADHTRRASSGEISSIWSERPRTCAIVAICSYWVSDSGP
jgi:hypothetical protein